MFGRNIIVKPTHSGDDVRRAAFLGEELFVHSIWPTIQGEGPHAGCPAIFVRLTGCNLRCHFCDTEFETGSVLTIDALVQRIKDDMVRCETDLIVLTGGEPMRQQIIPFLARCGDEGWYVQIETAGTTWPQDVEVAEHQPPQLHRTGDEPPPPAPRRVVSLGSLIEADFVQLVCSPKTPKIHPKVEEHCDHFKYIIRKGETDARGLPMMSTQIKGERAAIWQPHADNVLPTIWLQPCAEYMRHDPPTPDFHQTKVNQDEVVRLALKHGHRISLQQHRILEVD